MEIINKYGAITLGASSVLDEATKAFMDRMAILIKDASPADLRILAEISVMSVHGRFAQMVLWKAMEIRRAGWVLPKAE